MCSQHNQLLQYMPDGYCTNVARLLLYAFLRISRLQSSVIDPVHSPRSEFELFIVLVRDAMHKLTTEVTLVNEQMAMNNGMVLPTFIWCSMIEHN